MQFPSDDSSNNYTRRTEVLQGTQNVIDTELQFFSKAQTKVLVKETLQDLIKQLHQIVELMQKPFTINILIDIIEHRDAYNELKKLNVDTNVIQAANPTHEQIIDLLEIKKNWEDEGVLVDSRCSV